MQYSFTDRLKHAWNVFKSRDPTEGGNSNWRDYMDSDYRPGTYRSYWGTMSDRSIVASIKNRIAVDAAQVDIQHVRLDDNDRYLEKLDSGLNRCLSIEANIDQTGRAFRLDIFLSLLDEGVIALIPIDTDLNPDKTGGYDIETMRVGKIIDWYAKNVRVSVYDENTGKRKEVVVPKKTVAIVENPFYSVMNEPNSTFQRLSHKLALLDSVDEQASAGKLDLIIQLPYVVKGETRRQQAMNRRQEIEEQLNGSKYGIAWTDGTERIQQLNRPLENNLLGQIQFLTQQAFDQLGITSDILNGTADEKTMLNYNNRIIEPLVGAVADAMKRSFLTKTAITQRQSIEYFRDPFSLVPVNNIADIADKFTRNEILTSNKVRQIIGIKPSKDPNADMLRNKNLYDTTGTGYNSATGEEQAVVGPDNASATPEQEYSTMSAELDQIDNDLDELEASLEQSDSDEDILEHNYDPEYRHWYYYNVEKPGKKLGRDKSTSGLNEEGRAYLSWLRGVLKDEQNERNKKSKAVQDAGITASKEKQDAGINSSKEKMNAGITDSQGRRDAGIKRSQVNRDTTITSVNEVRDTKIGQERDRMNSDLDSLKNQRDTEISGITSERDRTIEAERSKTKSAIESFKNSVQQKISAIRETLSAMSKEEKAANKSFLQAEIDKLREENSEKRAELQAAFKESSSEAREKAKSESNEARTTHKKASESRRSEFKDTSSEVRSNAKKKTDKAKEEHTTESNKLREEHKNTTSELREGHKAESNKLREEHKQTTQILRDAYKAAKEQSKAQYDEEYEKNLEYIKSLPQYQKAKKSKSSSSNKTTRTNYHEVKKNP